MDIDVDEPDSPASAVPSLPAPLSRRRLLIIIAIALFLLAIVILAAVWIVKASSTTSTTITSSYPTSTRTPLEKLARLPVKGRAPTTDYDRDLFGPPWSDDVTVEGGHNGCDTRNDILRRDLGGAGFGPGNCVVLSGVLNDPYTGQTILYQHEPESLSPIQIDHIVPLKDAWQKGAQQWDELTRRNFANDPLNLQATTAAANQEKGSGDAATWLPANFAYRCTYASRIVEVKTRYGLSITEAEHETLAFLLANCDDVPVLSSLPPVPPSSVAPSWSSAAPRPVPLPPCYINVNGDCVPFPEDFSHPPAGVNALCRDGNYSFSAHRPGSCARHGGVARWMD